MMMAEPIENIVNLAKYNRILLLPDDAILFIVPKEYSLEIKNPAKIAGNSRMISVLMDRICPR